MMAAEHTPGEELMAYLDGELSAARAADVESHVAGCRTCQQVLGDFRQVSRDLARWTVEAPPAMSAPSAKADAASDRRGLLASLRAWSTPRLAVYATAAVALLAVSVTLMSRPGPRQEVSLATGRMGGAPVDAVASELAPETASAVAASPALEEAPQKPTASLREWTAQLPPASASSALSQSTGARTTRIIRSASLTIVAKDFPAARTAVEQVVQDVGGFVSTMHASEPRGGKRSLRASLRVPSERLAEALARLRGLGSIVEETQGGEDVTEHLIDLEARLANSRNTERRLNEVLKNRTGDVSDILEVEREIARVRQDIEQATARQKRLEERVSFATITLVVEERQAALDAGPIPITAQLRNAFVEGVQAAYESAVGIAVAAIRVGPFLLLWTAVLWWPLRKAWRAAHGARQA